MRLINPDASPPSDLPTHDLIKDQVSRGIVEVCTREEYVRVCHDRWNDQAASVVCRQLGFSSHGELKHSQYCRFPPIILFLTYL